MFNKMVEREIRGACDQAQNEIRKITFSRDSSPLSHFGAYRKNILSFEKPDGVSQGMQAEKDFLDY